MMREKLFFDGLAWPAARIIGRERVPGRHASGFFTGDQPNEAETFVVDTSGNGRTYQMQYAEGWWRDLAELKTTNERQVLSFLRAAATCSATSSPASQSAWSGGMPLLSSYARPLMHGSRSPR